MQAAGGLKKRSRRNIIKVKDKSITAYNGQEDNVLISFDSKDLPDELCWEEQNTDGLKKSQNFLLDDKMILRFRQLLFMGVTSFVFPWSWNKRSRTVEKWSDKWTQAFWVIWSCIALQTTLLTFYNIYAVINVASQLSYRLIFASSLAIYWYLLTLGFTLMMYFYMEDIRCYVNTLIKFHTDNCELYLSRGVSTSNYPKGTFNYMGISTWINYSQLTFSVFIFFVTPYQPWYLHFYLKDLNLPWYAFILGGIQQYIVVGNALANCLLMLWISMAHGKICQFWLQEINKDNDSGYTVDRIREPLTSLHIYRSTQILCKLFSIFMSTLGLPCVVFTVFAGAIPCAFVLIRSFGPVFYSEFPGILTYPIGVVNTFSYGYFILMSLAVMNGTAQEFLDSWSRTKQKVMRQMLVASFAVRARIGFFYDASVVSNREFVKTTVDYLVDCIITFR